MKRLLYAALLFAACSTAPSEPAIVAEAAYEALIAGQWEQYLSLTSTGDSLPRDIRQERIDMLREYMSIEQTLRGGMTAAKALRDTLVDDDNAFVFMELQWADSTKEEIMLPMVRVGDVWRIR